MRQFPKIWMFLTLALLTVSVGTARTLEEEKEFKGTYSVTNGTTQSMEKISGLDGDGLTLTDDSGVNTNGIVIEDGGNVGIGVADPTVKLDVGGTVQTSLIQATDATLTNPLPTTSGGMGTTSTATFLNTLSPLLKAIHDMAPSNGEYLQFLSSTTAQKLTTANLKAQFGYGDMADQTSSSVSITGGSISGITDLAVADGGTGASSAGDARTNLGVAIGSDVVQYSAQIDSLRTLTNTDGYLIRMDGSGYERQTTSAFIGDLGLTVGTDVQAYGARLQSLSDLVPTAGDFLKYDGSNSYVSISTATMKTHLNYGSMADQSNSSVNIDGGNIDGTTIGGTTPAVGTFSDLTVNGTLSAGEISKTWLRKTADYQLSAGENISFDSTGGSFRLTAVASSGLATGATLKFMDVGDSANDIYIDPDGSDNIESANTPLDITQAGSVFDLVWTGNATIGWRVIVHK